jgi:hypothetical protein
VAAAPHLFDDPIASPELALVDAELAAQLRADLATGDPFRPRDVPRAEYPTLVFDAVVRDLAVDERDVPAGQVPLVEEPVELVDESVPQDEPFAPSALEGIALPEDESFELPAYVVAGDHAVVPDPGVAESDVAEVPVALVEELALPEEQSFEHPDYFAGSAEDAGDTVDELPDYVVRPVDEAAAAPPDSVVAPDEVPAVDEIVADIAFDEDVIRPIVVEASTELGTSSDYPVLPDLDECSNALEATEAALRRIREQMVVPGGKPISRVRRRLAIVSGLGLGVALAAVAVEVQLGVLHAPGWLGL